MAEAATDEYRGDPVDPTLGIPSSAPKEERSAKSPPAANDDDPVSKFTKRFDPDKIDALSRTLGDIERQKGAAEQAQYGSLNRKLEADRAQMEKAFRAESASPDSLPPQWEADKERRERIRTPIEDFGSIGSIFGILASQFTKTPLTSAMFAASSAMNAIREHDEEGYKSAYQAWKDNTALALKRFDMERALFEDANKLVSTDLQQWKVKQLAIAAQFDNKKAIAMLDAGMSGELLELQEKSIGAAQKLQKVMEDQQVFDDRRQVLSAGMKQFDKDHPDANPYQRAMARLDLLKATVEGKNSWQVEELNRWRAEYVVREGHEPSDE